jgi:class 3 adenylate cyclase/tetratricopeptide (TPR) repeat protein
MVDHAKAEICHSLVAHLAVAGRVDLESPVTEASASDPVELADRLLPYVPRLLAEELTRPPSPRVLELDASVAYVDISGFTRLSERLARAGKEGAEELAEAIGSCFTALLADAYANGGRLIKFGGDALLLLFSDEHHAVRACQAASQMRRTLRDVGRLDTSSGAVRLRMSVGIHSGRFHLFVVGDSHRELIVTGPGASRTVEMESAAEAGEILVSPETAAELPRSVIGRSKGPGRLLARRPQADLASTTAGAPSFTCDELLQGIPEAIREHLLSGVGSPEHRQAVVSFIRFEGTDGLLRRHGSDACLRALDDLVKRVQEAANHQRLTFLASDIDRDGGKIILVGGVPRSHGNDEERMLLALRGLVDGELPLRTRVGVNRGNVFSGDIGPHYRRTYTVMGDTVNLAARLMARADVGQIVATPAVLDASPTRFVTEELEPFLVKGKAKPVRAFAVGPVAVGERERARSVRLIGREQEMGVICTLLDQARGGRGHFLEIVGDAGIGKTRLIEELRAEAHGFAVHTVTCQLQDETTPYGASSYLLRRLLGLDEGTRGEAVVARLRAVVTQDAPQLEPWIPLLATPMDEVVAATPETSELDERFRRERVTSVVVEFVSALTRDPTVLIFEDAHRMDGSSAELLNSLGAGAGDRPWVVCVARRDVGSGFIAPDEPWVEHLRPQPLDQTAAQDMLLALTEDDPLRPDQVLALARRAGGSPLFLRELVKAVGAAGGVDDLPDSVEALVTARVDRLSTPDRDLLQRISVLGTAVPLRWLPAVLDRPAPDPADDVWRRVGDLVEVRDGTLRFEHDLLRAAAYEKLPYRLRRELHGRAGSRIEASLDDPDEESDLLSYHFFHAGWAREAWRYSTVAGERASQRYAPVETSVFFQRALDVARGLPEITPGERAEVAEALGDALVRAGEFAAAERSYRLARAEPDQEPVAIARVLRSEAWIAERQGRLPVALRRISAGEHALIGADTREALAMQAQLAALRGAIRQSQGRSREAVRSCRQAIRAAEAAGDDKALAHASYILDWALIELGRTSEATNSPRALQIYERLGDFLGQAIVLNNLGMFAYWEGRWDEARELYGRGTEACERAGDPVNAALGELNIGEVLSDQGWLDEAEVRFERARRVWQATGSRHGVAYVASFQGRAAARAGRFEEARRRFAEASALFREIGATADVTEVEIFLAESYVLEGRPDDALMTLEESRGSGGARATLAARVRGLALLQRGDVDEGRAALELSLAIARDRGADHEAASTLLELARFESEAHIGAAAEASAIFERLGVHGVPEAPLDLRDPR